MNDKHRPPAFSVCIIARNEATNIASCLDALLRIPEAEIIVADTGSTDGTAEIAGEKGARVVSFDWTDDFSAARNFAASHASHDLILAVDADEVLTDADLPLFAARVREHPDAVGMILRISPTFREDGTQSFHERVARCYDRTRFHYVGRIHENIAPLATDEKTKYYELPLTFLHSGYEAPDKIREKALRDLELLRRALGEEGPSPYLYYQIGKCHVALREQGEAVLSYEKGLAMNPEPDAVYVREMTESCGYCLLETGRPEKALSLLLSVKERYAYHADFLFLLGLVYMNCARFEEAVDSFLKATECVSFSVEGCNSFRACYNIGVITEVLGNLKEAAAWYRRCGDFAPAVQRLQAFSADRPSGSSG